MRDDWEFLWGLGIIVAIVGFVWLAADACNTDCAELDDPLEREVCADEQDTRDQVGF